MRLAPQNGTTFSTFDTATINVPLRDWFAGLSQMGRTLQLRLRRRGPGWWLAVVAIVIGDAALAGIAWFAVDAVLR